MSEEDLPKWDNEINAPLMYLPQKPKTNSIMKTLGVLITLSCLVIVGSFAYLISTTVYEVSTYEPTYETELDRDATMTIEYLWFIADDGDDGDDISIDVHVDYDDDDEYDFTCKPSIRWHDEYSNIKQNMNNACQTDIWISQSTSSASAKVDGLDISVWPRLRESTASYTPYDVNPADGCCGVEWNDRTYQAPAPAKACEYDGQTLTGEESKTFTANGLDDGDDENYNMHTSFKVMINYTYTCNQVA